MQQNVFKSKSDLVAEYYSQHYEEVRAYVASRVKYADEAEDIVQDVFLRLLKMDKMITSVTLPCLVYTVARNLVFDYWRHHQCVNEYEHFLCKRNLGHRIYDAESVYSAQELTEVLERGIARLCDKQRSIYRLNVCDGLKVGEIAMRLELNYKSVENRLGAARKQVRLYMKRMLA